MKVLLNWRLCVRYALFAVGFLCIALAFGEDDLPMAEWCVTHLSLFSLGIGSFALLGKLEKKWGNN